MRAARRRLGWNRESLAFHAGISWSAIAQIEAGRRTNLRPATLTALASALSVTIDYLVSGRRATHPMLEHCELPYDSDAGFLAAAVPFLMEAIKHSEPALVVSTEANIGLLRGELNGDATDIEFVEREHWYDEPGSALARYQSFLDAKLESGAAWVRIIGEPIWAQKSDSQVRLWARYESLINLAFASAPLTLLCPYDARVLDEKILSLARTTHPHAVAGEVRADCPEFADPSGFVLEG